MVNNPEDPSAGTRQVPFSRELYIEHDDFREDPPKKFFRLAPGREVRLRNAYLITCREVVNDPATGAGRRAALHVRSRDARRRRAGRPQGEGDAALGLGRSTPSTEKCACTIGCSPSRSRQRPKATDWLTTLNPSSLEVLRRASSSRRSPSAAVRHALPVRAARLLRRRSRHHARASGVQPHGHAQGQLGQNRGQRLEAVLCPCLVLSAGCHVRCLVLRALCFVRCFLLQHQAP